MKIRQGLYLGAGTVLITALAIFLTFFFIPDQVLYGLLSRILEQQGYSWRAARFGKAFPLGVQATDMEISGPRGVLLKAGAVKMHLNIFPLFFGKIAVAGRAVIGAGHIEGSFLAGNKESRIEVRGIRLEDIPFFQTVTGTQVRGEINLKGGFKWNGKKSEGELRLEIKEAGVTGVKIGNIPLPDADHGLVQVWVQGQEGLARLKGFTFQSRGLYVRLQGEVPFITPLDSAPLRLTLELMPKPEFLERQKIIFLFLAHYLNAPGYYRIPIRGTLTNPLVL
jgi:type II secretion system protein N